MNETQARVLREAHDAYVKSIYRLSKPKLSALYREEMAAQGMFSLFGGPSSKDELISALVELRYPLAKMNESVHVLYHRDGVTSDVCEWCNPDPCPYCGAIGPCDPQLLRSIVNGRHVPDEWDVARPAASARLTDA